MHVTMFWTKHGRRKELSVRRMGATSVHDHGDVSLIECGPFSPATSFGSGLFFLIGGRLARHAGMLGRGSSSKRMVSCCCKYHWRWRLARSSGVGFGQTGVHRMGNYHRVVALPPVSQNITSLPSSFEKYERTMHLRM
ncbi:hypothetical protein VTL71DRAFT_5411 [Oculimacula yallundae]|uniref:Uncharacterized protein n=1 Tax=Oculimacula yallundae TaxID=86028 RepID=A0ABR4C267_9HELO